MAHYSIKEISSGRDLRAFIRFPERLYRKCPQYVPALRSGERKSLTDSAPLRYCTRKLWLVYDEKGEIAGRICAMVNPRYNELYGKKRARFGWFDTVDSAEVARLLLGTAEEWAKSLGMNEMHGPLSYNTLGKQGMLVEGFQNMPVFNTLYNYPYYNTLLTELGYGKECDWLEYRMAADQGTPEKMKRIADRLMERYHLHEGSISALKKDPAMVRKFFDAYNESFAQSVYNFIPFTEEEIEEEAAAFLPYLDDTVSSVILDENEDLVAFGISIPDISKALQKAKGRLFPFGWLYLKRALKRYGTVDMMINGAVPKWQNTGVSAVYHCKMSDKYQAVGAKWALANPQLESNGAVNVWDRYGNELYMRRRCYIKAI